MKKRFNLVATIVLLATISVFTSCQNEEVINTGGETARVKFSIGIPKGDPVTYAIHDGDEWGIESLWMYEYSVEGKLLAAPVNIKTGLNGTGPTYTYEKELPTDQKGSRRFVFVANEEPADAAKVVGSDMSVLKGVLATKTQAASTSSSGVLNTFGSNQRIPMTGTGKQGTSEIIAVTGATEVSVTLTRIVARVDITNRVPNLVISEVKLNNANSQSNLFLTGDYTVPTTSTKVTGITTFASMPTPSFDNDPTNATGAGRTLAKAFYLYEGTQAAQATATSIQVRGTLSGVPVLYNIPFWQNNAGVTVKRNHIYRIILGDNTPMTPNTNVNFTIADTPWNEITMNERFDIISAKFTTTSMGTFTGNTLTVGNTAQTGFTFTLATQFANHTAFTAALADVATTWVKNIVVDNAAKTVKFDVDANNASGAVDRTATIQIKSNADANTVYNLVVTQTK